jgi:hypothetical protein
MITSGAIEPLVRPRPPLSGHGASRRRHEVWQRLGIWLRLGLEFELAADIIRTYLNDVLESDIEKRCTINKKQAA